MTTVVTALPRLTGSRRALRGLVPRPRRLLDLADHAGGTALLGGLSALEQHGLKNWRDEGTVLVDDERVFDPVPGVTFFRTRRPLEAFRARRSDLPLCRVEPAALLFAAYERSERTAHRRRGGFAGGGGRRPDLSPLRPAAAQTTGASSRSTARSTWPWSTGRTTSPAKRGLSGPGRVIVRCTARELRDRPEVVVRDLKLLAVSQLCA